jgi:hypothetical protein
VVCSNLALTAGFAAASSSSSLSRAAGRGTIAVTARGLVKLQQDSRQAEARAATILNYQPLGIPGLLQVPEYSRRLIAAGYPRRGSQEVAAAVKARMDRQVILYDESRHFEFVMGAASLYWRPGPASLMRAHWTGAAPRPRWPTRPSA